MFVGSISEPVVPLLMLINRVKTNVIFGVDWMVGRENINFRLIVCTGNSPPRHLALHCNQPHCVVMVVSAQVDLTVLVK